MRKKPLRCPGTMEKTDSTYTLSPSESVPSLHHQTYSRNCGHQVPPSVKHKIKVTLEFIRNLKLEAFLLVYVMAFSMRLMITQDLLLTKTCLHHLNYSEQMCSHPTEEVKSETEKIANTVNLFTILVQLVPSALLSIFVGTWSDRYGNKMPILIAILGGLVTDFGNAFTAVYMESSLYWSVLAALPNGISGGLVSVWAAVYSHATISTSPDLRTVKFLMITLAIQLGFPFGQFISGQVFKSWGYVPVYAVSFTLLLACFVWMLIMVRGQKNPGVSKLTMAKDFFKLDNFVEGVRTTVRERPNSGRKQILLMLATMCVIVLNAETTRSVTYYFVKKQFDWSVTKYSDVTSLFALVNLVSIGPLVLILTKGLKVRDVTLSIIGVTSMLLQNFTRGLAYREWMYYASAILGTAGGVSTIGITSHVSRIVSQNEIARMFSFWAACEAMVPVLGDVMSSQVFNATIDALPGAPFIISSLLLILPLGSLVYCYRKSMDDFELFEEEGGEANGSEMASSPSLCSP
ncbi:proton-coupled folate transporter [Galendromus occidentalis]|uniref:Proton-coupled folate transporter n=1 Tax=Galendromus occidentalis TaxID=34638 RepID=A0AAJ7L7U7_9ACAR|nr:proton-coupled folate transporter [Galendromus occidentalis]